MYTPGYYKTNPRALTVRELMRMSGIVSLPFAFLITRFMRPTGGVWMPSLWNDNDCARNELSPEFWEATTSPRHQLERLGFKEVAFFRVTRHLISDFRDSGGILYLDPSGSQIGTLGYAKVRARGLIVSNLERINVTFTNATSQGSISCSNAKETFDPPFGHKVIRINSKDLEILHQRLLKELPESPLVFSNPEALRNWLDSIETAAFEERVRRRLLVRMSDAEIEVARRRLPPPIPLSRAA